MGSASTCSLRGRLTDSTERGESRNTPGTTGAPRMGGTKGATRGGAKGLKGPTRSDRGGLQFRGEIRSSLLHRNLTIDSL